MSRSQPGSGTENVATTALVLGTDGFGVGAYKCHTCENHTVSSTSRRQRQHYGQFEIQVQLAHTLNPKPLNPKPKPKHCHQAGFHCHMVQPSRAMTTENVWDAHRRSPQRPARHEVLAEAQRNGLLQGLQKRK